jgi:integrase
MQLKGQGHIFRPKYRVSSGEVRLSGVYWWKAPSGQRYSTGFRDFHGAQLWAVERATEMRLGIAASELAPAKYDDLERMLLDDWIAKGRRGVPQAVARLKHLRRAFSGWHAAAITSDRVTGYAVRRRAEGAAAATINVEIAILHRAFVLAKRSGRLRDIPIMDRLRDVGHRTGTVERGDLEAILLGMRARYRGVLRFLYWTGWREGEALSLTWASVDVESRELRLDAENSKTGQPRIFCYASLPELDILIQKQRMDKLFSPYVFPGRANRRIDRTALQKNWRLACRKAGVPGALIHDLRRTMVRDMRRAGVPLAVAMGAVGHENLSVHQGYSTVARQDQDAGMASLAMLRAGEPVQQKLLSFGGR